MMHVKDVLAEGLGSMTSIEDLACAECGKTLDTKDFDELDRMHMLQPDASSGNPLWRCGACAARLMRELRAKSIGALMASAGVPKRYLNCTRETWRGDWPIPEFCKPRQFFDALVILGPTGTGKTHLATALLAQWLIDEPNCAWRDTQLLADELKSDVENSSEVIHKLSRYQMLVLDDYGNERSTPFVAEMLSMLLRKRHADMLPVVVTSNLSMRQLGEADPRLASRLASGCVITLAGQDRRIQLAHSRR